MKNYAQRLLGPSALLLGATSGTATAQSGDVALIGAGCPGGASSVPSIDLAGFPAPGDSIEIVLSTAPGTGPFILLAGLTPTGLDLSGVGYPGCVLETDILTSFLLAPDAAGVGRLPLNTWAAGLTVYFQGIQLNPLGYGFTPGLAVTSGSQPAAPPLTQSSGEEGATVSLPGLDLPETTADQDILAVGEGTRGFMGRSTQVDGSGASIEMTSLTKYAVPGPLSLFVGDGAEIALPDVNGVSYPAGAWVWYGPSGADAIETPNDFEPETESLEGACKPFDDYVDLHFEYVDNQLRLALPGEGPCSGDSVSIALQFETDQEKVAVNCPQSAEFNFATTLWNFAYLNVLTPLATCLDPTRYSVTYDTVTQELVITPLNGATILSLRSSSRTRLHFDMDHHTEYDLCEGEMDAFSTANGNEWTSPYTDWQDAWFDYFAVVGGQVERKQYDETGNNKYLLETIDMNDPALGTGRIRAVQFEFRMEAIGDAPYTDSFSLGWDGTTTLGTQSQPVPVRDYSINLEALPETGLVFTPGEDVHMTVDLSSLLRADGSTVSMLERVIPMGGQPYTGRLDFHLQDDTKVDYVKVCVLRCND